MLLTLFMLCVACNTTDTGSIAIVVPYRARPHHLSVFHRYIHHYWKRNFGCKSLWLLVVEQNNNEPFNRAALANVGILEVHNAAKILKLRIDCIVFHDVDLLPLYGVDYTSCAVPTQLGSELQHFQWSVPYKKSAGGIVSMSPSDWFKVNGFSNKYKGWGQEDDDLYNRLKANKMLLPNQEIARPAPGHGRFRVIDEGTIHHPRNRDHLHRKINVNNLFLWSKHPNAWQNDGLNSLSYTINFIKQIQAGMHIWVTFP